MQVELAYGKSGLAIELPDGWPVTVLEPRFVAGLADSTAALRAALRQPTGAPALRDAVQAGDSVGIVFSDITRPVPSRLILPAVLDELAHVPRDQITLFNALGTHRANTREELAEMIGADLVTGYRVVQNDAFDPETQVHIGRTARGHEVWLNREAAACDVLVLTGFIEPHFFAGFSGGGKALMPGMAGQRTVLGNHDAGMIAHPGATWGVTRGNPIWEEVMEVALIAGSGATRTRRIFLVNVTLNRQRQITGVFAGDLQAAHAAGCRYVKETAMVRAAAPFDLVIAANSGYPLDINLYQAVKAMSAAAQVVRDGGAIIVAAECRDGIPEHGRYSRLLRQSRSPRHLLDTITAPGHLEQDQWQAQIQAQVQLKAEVHVYSDHLSDRQIREALLTPCRSIEDTVARLRTAGGARGTIGVLPDGPQTIAYLE